MACPRASQPKRCAGLSFSKKKRKKILRPLFVVRIMLLVFAFTEFCNYVSFCSTVKAFNCALFSAWNKLSPISCGQCWIALASLLSTVFFLMFFLYMRACKYLIDKKVICASNSIFRFSNLADQLQGIANLYFASSISIPTPRSCERVFGCSCKCCRVYMSFEEEDWKGFHIKTQLIGNTWFRIYGFQLSPSFTCRHALFHEYHLVFSKCQNH